MIPEEFRRLTADLERAKKLGYHTKIEWGESIQIHRGTDPDNPNINLYNSQSGKINLKNPLTDSQIFRAQFQSDINGEWDFWDFIQEFFNQFWSIHKIKTNPQNLTTSVLRNLKLNSLANNNDQIWENL